MRRSGRDAGVSWATIRTVVRSSKRAVLIAAKEVSMLDRWFKRRHTAIQGSNGSDTAADAHLIQLRQVKKIYESAAGAFTALKSIDLEIDRGEFVAVIGKSGSGKSTLINMITGIDRPT